MSYDEDDELDADLSVYREFVGSRVTLQLATPDDELAAAFKTHPAMTEAIGHVDGPVDRDRLEHLMEEDTSLYVWSLVRNNERVGYCFLVSYDGPPYIAVHNFDGDDFATNKDCVEQLMPAFFKHSQESSLFIYLGRPVDPEVHAELVDGGFDPWDENPTVDNGEVATYIMERHTYDAYYGEGEEEFEAGDPYDDY